MLSRTQSVINQVSHSLKTSHCSSYSRSFSSSGNANKGFASMPKEKVQEIGSMGGKAHSESMKSDRIVGDHGASRRNADMDHNDAMDRRSMNNSTQQNGIPHNANINNVVGGYKATINNPNVSQQAKSNAEHVLNNMENAHPGITEDSVATKAKKNQSTAHTSTSNNNYASNSNNVNSTEDPRSMANRIYAESNKGDRIGEAPVSQRRMEMAHNETVEHDPSTGSLEHSEAFNNKNINNVIGGYKATINNPNVGQHAKARAEHLLKELESEHPGITEDSIATKSKKNQIHVDGTEDSHHSTSTLNNTHNMNSTQGMSTGRSNTTNNYTNNSEVQNRNPISNSTNQGRNDYVTMSQVQDMINPLAATLNRIEQQLSSGNHSTSNVNHRSNQETHGKQGFASMPKEKVQEIASMGGRSHGQSHSNDSHNGTNSTMESMNRASADANRRDTSSHNVVGNERNTQRK